MLQDEARVRALGAFHPDRFDDHQRPAGDRELQVDRAGAVGRRGVNRRARLRVAVIAQGLDRLRPEHQVQPRGVGALEGVACQAIERLPRLRRGVARNRQSTHPVGRAFADGEGEVHPRVAVAELVSGLVDDGIQVAPLGVGVPQRGHGGLDLGADEGEASPVQQRRVLPAQELEDGGAVQRLVAFDRDPVDDDARALVHAEDDRRPARVRDLVADPREGIPVAAVGLLHAERGVVDVRRPAPGAPVACELGRRSPAQGALALVRVPREAHLDGRRLRGGGPPGPRDGQEQRREQERRDGRRPAAVMGSGRQSSPRRCSSRKRPARPPERPCPPAAPTRRPLGRARARSRPPSA